MIIGILVYSIICVSLLWESEVALILISIAFAIIGGIFSWRNGKEIVLYGTSLIGSYIFMRGIAAFYGGFPDLGAVFSGEEELDYPALFALSLAIFIISFVVSSTF